MEVQDVQGRPLQVNDIVRTLDGRLLQVKGWANVADPSVKGVHVAARETELVTRAADAPEMASQIPVGEMTILWGLEPPPPPPPE